MKPRTIIDPDRDTPRTDAVAKMIGRLACQLKTGELELHAFAIVAQHELDKLGAMERELNAALTPSPAPSKEMEERSTPKTDAVAEMLGRLAFQLNNGDLSLQDFADVAQVELDKLGVIERERDQLKRELAETVEVARKYQHEALALSASYQRQKEVLKEIHAIVGALPFKHMPLKLTIDQALDETPDVSLPETIIKGLEVMKSACASDEDFLTVTGFVMKKCDELLSTLQPDHQK